MSASRTQAVANSPGVGLVGDTLDPHSGARFSWASYLWFAPAILVLFLVTLYPSFFVAWLSFQKTRYYDLVGFVGVANYSEVLGSSAFWNTVVVSLAYVLGSLAGALVLGM